MGPTDAYGSPVLGSAEARALAKMGDPCERACEAGGRDAERACEVGWMLNGAAKWAGGIPGEPQRLLQATDQAVGTRLLRRRQLSESL